MTPLEILIALASFVSFLVSLAMPSHASCPAGFYVGGARPSGVYSCVRTPARDVCDTKGGCADITRDPRFDGRLWCTGGAVAIVSFDGRSVGCQRVAP